MGVLACGCLSHDQSARQKTEEFAQGTPKRTEALVDEVRRWFRRRDFAQEKKRAGELIVQQRNAAENVAEPLLGARRRVARPRIESGDGGCLDLARILHAGLGNHATRFLQNDASAAVE